MFILSEDYWEIKEVPEKGRGVSAKKDIPGGTLIGDYIGRVTRSEDVDEQKEGLYDMWYNYQADIVADPSKIGVHFLNHSCSPNCDTFPYKNHMLVFALRKIFAGEELSLAYYLEPPDDEKFPCAHACHCGSPICHGTFHTTDAVGEKWGEFVESMVGKENFHKPPPVAYGEQLPALQKYPEHIDDYPIYDLYGSLTEEPLNCEDDAVPKISQIRTLIRESGHQLNFSKLGIIVFGIMRGMVIVFIK